MLVEQQEKECNQERVQKLHQDSQETTVTHTTSLDSILSVPEVCRSVDMCRYV